MRKLKKKIQPKKEYDCIITSGEIISEPEIIEYTDKVKTVFDIRTDHGNEIKCVYWARTKAQKGNRFSLKGRIRESVLIVWGMLLDTGERR